MPDHNYLLVISLSEWKDRYRRPPSRLEMRKVENPN